MSDGATTTAHHLHAHSHTDSQPETMATLEVTDLPVPAKDVRFPSTNQALNCW